MAGVVKSAQATIEEHWPKHAEHTTKSRTRAPRWSTAEGIVCACGDVLGWPDPDHHETLSQYTKRTAQEQVDAAIEKGEISRGTAAVKGAFGEYPKTPVPTDDPVATERREIDEAYAVDTAGDPGPEESPELDWGEPPEDEPEPVVLTIDRDTPRVRDVQLPDAIEDGDGEDVGTAPIPADAVPDDRGNMIAGGQSYGQPSGAVDFGKLADEVTEPVTVFEADADLYPADEAQARPWSDAEEAHRVREGLTPWDGTGERPERWQDSDGIGWTPPENATAEEVAASGLYPAPDLSTMPKCRGSIEGRGGEPVPCVFPVSHGEDLVCEIHEAIGSSVVLAPETIAREVTAALEPYAPWWVRDEKPSNEGVPEEKEPEVGRDLVPFAGTPLMPTDPNSMDPLNRALPPLDPTLPYTPADVELKILEVLQQGERGERFLREQLARLHQAQHNLDLRYNLAIRKSDARAADQRKADAWIATEKERYEATEAEMLVRALRDNLHNLRAQLSGFQSVARSLGVSLTNALDGRDAPRRVESHREPPPVAPWEYQ